jgi:digeranylgeranylglycerophospholipid reductase
MLDVAIIGGGPAGLYAGTLLAHAGFSVVLFEEHPVVGQPVHCTGVLAAEAFDEFDLPRTCVLNELATAKFIAPSGASISYTTPRTEAIVIDRGRLDQSLAQRAAIAGVDIRVGSRVQHVEPLADRMRLDVAGEQVEARSVILACGASYGLQRRLGLGMPTVALNSAQLELPAQRSGDVEVYFGGTVAAGGFAWTVPVTRPHGQSVRVGLMCQGDPAPAFRRFVRQVAASWGVPADVIAEPRRRYLPLSTLPRTFAPRVLAIGDAAGLVKPTTGGGIYYSVVSAKLAAETLAPALTADHLGEDTLGTYQERWRRRFGPELRAQLALRMLAQRMSDVEIDAFFELARTNGVMPLVRRAATFNQHRHLITELFRHAPSRRLLFRRLVAV